MSKLKATKTGDTLAFYIYDEIGPSDQGFCGAEELIGLLNDNSSVSNIEIRINSPGGDVGESLAIYNALDRHYATKTVFIDGLALSGASIVAMAGDSIVMAPQSLLMLHNAWTMTAGPASDLRKTADVLDKMDRTMIEPVYQKRTGLSLTTIRNLMADETWLSPAEAIAKGFADRIGNDVGVTASVEPGRYRNTPKQLFGDELKNRRLQYYLPDALNQRLENALRESRIASLLNS